MMISNYFYLSIATIIEPDNYKQEFQCAKKTLRRLTQIYPSLSLEVLQSLVVTTYEFHPFPISVMARLEYIKIMLVLGEYIKQFGYRVDDFGEEVFNRQIYCRIQLGKKLSRQAKLAIRDITYFHSVYQNQYEKELILTKPATFLPQ